MSDTDNKKSLKPFFWMWGIGTVLAILLSLWAPGHFMPRSMSGNMHLTILTMVIFSVAAAPVVAGVYAASVYAIRTWGVHGDDIPPPAEQVRDHPRYVATWLVASTVLTVLLAGPILGILGAHSSASQLGLLATLALVVALPLAAGSAMRTLDPFSGREQPLVRVLGTVSLLVLLWEVASELHLRASDTRVVIALLLYLAGGAVLGWLLATGVPSRRRTAIVLPTAMRDFAVAAGIATSAFGATAAAPLGIYGILVLVFGTVTVYAVRRH